LNWPSKHDAQFKALTKPLQASSHAAFRHFYRSFYPLDFLKSLYSIGHAERENTASDRHLLRKQSEVLRQDMRDLRNEDRVTRKEGNTVKQKSDKEISKKIESDNK
jgi:hypothetical protein